MADESVLEQALEGAAKEFLGVFETPPLMAMRFLRSATAGVHPTRMAEVAAKISEAQPRISEMIRRGDSAGLERELSQVCTAIRYGGFANPAIEPTPLEKWGPTLVAYQYDGSEIDLLFGMLKPSERIMKVSWWAVTSDHRTLTRREIRLAGRPRWGAQSDGEWLEKWEAVNPIPTRELVEFQAEHDLGIAAALKAAGSAS